MTDAVPIRDVWKFCPRCGVRSAIVGEHPFRCSECRYTHYFSPDTAVGALIIDASGAMLFIVRGKDPGKGKLGLPGGFVDAGETAEESLIREVEEELSLTVVSWRYLASFPNTYTFGGIVSPVTDLFYVAEVATLDGISPQVGEIDSWTFLAAEQVAAEDLAFDTHRRALEVYLQNKDT